MSLNFGDVSSLAELLEPNLKNERARPAGQVTGYSGEPPLEVAEKKTDGSNPSSIPLPQTAVDVQLGLPIPAKTKKGRELAARTAQPDAYAPPSSGDNIWSFDEVTEVAVAVDSAHVAPIPTVQCAAAGPGAAARSMFGARARGREAPQYETRLIELRGPEDVYLGVDFERDGSSRAAEGIAVKIVLEKVKSAADIMLDVEEEVLTVQTLHDYYLEVPLPFKVEGKIAKAFWDASTHTLEVKLKRMVEKGSVVLI